MSQTAVMRHARHPQHVADVRAALAADADKPDPHFCHRRRSKPPAACGAAARRLSGGAGAPRSGGAERRAGYLQEGPPVGLSVVVMHRSHPLVSSTDRGADAPRYAV